MPSCPRYTSPAIRREKVVPRRPRGSRSRGPRRRRDSRRRRRDGSARCARRPRPKYGVTVSLGAV
jgi:hypothetical protein